MVVGGKCPLGPFSSLHMHEMKVRVHTFRRLHNKRSLVYSRKEAAHKLPDTKCGLFGLKEFEPLYKGQVVPVATENNRVVAYINKNDYEIRVSLCPSLETLVQVQPQADLPEGLPCIRPFKHDSRQALSSPAGYSDGIAHVSGDLNKFASPSSERLIHHRMQQVTSVSLVPDAKAWAVYTLHFS